MVAMADIKQHVREFYDQVGWLEVSEGVYQNARYEDLRPVSREYIHRCHLRVSRHIKPEGRYFLDAGSGPIQYPEYLEYSKGYNYRVCADISYVALQEARKRVGDHGLFVVADVANLPFAPETFEGVVSLHTIHHLPQEEHVQAYRELYRVLSPGCSASVVNGWGDALIPRLLSNPMRWTNRLLGVVRRLLGITPTEHPAKPVSMSDDNKPTSTFVRKDSADWLKEQLATLMPIEIVVWRGISVKHLRTFIHQGWGGCYVLRFLFWLEERFPHFFGEKGQYPLVVIRKMSYTDEFTERTHE
ncbi:MAG: class I SAM-dependent methyltransferase [Chloroflexi bacterium]|nr:class I SAM-dependent methyltransferase [Chloroflexota bacterium]